MINPDAHRHALQRILDADHPPRTANGDRQLPWHDRQFSRRMLAVHLDPETHMASRRPEVIAAHVDWLERTLRAHRPTGPLRVLDVGCGPGLYCHELARRGIQAVGFDFAPVPLAWARDTATEQSLDCRFLDLDLTSLPADFAQRTGTVDAITFWFGEFNSFTPAQVADFLPRLAKCLDPGGLFVLEYQPLDRFVQEDSSEWSVQESSVFCDQPHLWLQEFGWDEAARTEVHVHWILERESGTLHRYVQCHQGWTDAQLVSLLADAQLVDAVFHEPVTGADEAFEFPILVARRSTRSA